MMDEYSYLKQLNTELLFQKEQILMEQLNELISRDLLVVEETEPVLVREFNSNKVSLKQSVRLTLKDKEYIIKLEDENKQLKETLAKFKELYETME